ncbi:MAG: transposase [Candidatus Omnitrophica bacterium]|nr:transposase [Candidatus Omnitrophota bacterium]MBU4488244.1 transposase [Candidatus Omnitrophota bacterium]MCG2704692.1 transposase [Candidatus Omnitrophota bacterium]
MPRTKRILYDGAIYHIVNRGHNKQVLFKNHEDYIRFKSMVSIYLERYAFKIFNYCLMINHFHFLMQIGKAADLPLIMKGVSQTYANYYKRKYGTIGYLFQNRYKSILIEKDAHLLVCARYIERNPLRASLVSELSEYPWSSYHYYATGKKDDIITPNILYDNFGNSSEEKRRNYIEYISEEQPYELLLDEAIAKMK